MIRHSLLALAGVFVSVSCLLPAGVNAAPPDLSSTTAGKPTATPADSTSQSAPVPTIVSTNVVSQVSGANSPNHTDRWDLYGGDLGHMMWHRGSLYMVFGDSFGKPGLFGKHWRSNTMAKIADPDPRHGFPIATMMTAPDGTAEELVHSRKIDGLEMTVIPTNGISIDGRMYLDYMSVKHWDATDGAWTVGHSGVAYSDDNGQTWNKPESAVWPGGTGFEQVAFVRQDDAIYSFGIPEGRFGGVRLRRVAPDKMLDLSAYQYWNGSAWTADATTAAVIVPAPVGELSVAWSSANHAWVMMYLDQKAVAIVLRTAPRLTGPWSEKHTVITSAQYPGLYAPFIVPGSTVDKDIYYTMSLWSKYNVFLMHTTLDWAAPAIASATDSAVRVIPTAGENLAKP